MVEQSIEELTIELEKYKKLNLERELMLEKAKANEAEELKKKEDYEKLEEEIREKVLKELKPESRIETVDAKKPTTLDRPWTDEMETLKKNIGLEISKELGHEVVLTGRKYEDFITEKFPKQWYIKGDK